jgi:nicotinate-nucleotide--dimethylbenzimidazole phosphoribosyltransferase
MMASSNPNRTTVLEPGLVESRGFGGKDGQTKDELSNEIEQFLQDNGISFRTEARCFWGIFIFVTSLPGPRWVTCHPGFLMKGMCYFPVVGTIVGCLVAIVFDFGVEVLQLSPIVAAALSMAASFRWTGCLHEDGLADAADGIGGGWTRQQILKIMTDTRLGTFGTCTLALYMFVKMHLLAELGKSHWAVYNAASSDGEEFRHSSWSSGAGPALLVCHGLTRLTAPYLIHQNDYVEEYGPKSHFYSFMIRAKFLVSLPRVIFSSLYCLGVATILYGPTMAMALIAVVWLCSEIAGYYGRHKLGGVMGDYLGAVTCLTEVTLLTFLLSGSRIVNGIYELKTQASTTMTSGDFDAIQNLMTSMTDNSSLGASLRFLLFVIVYQLWGWSLRPSESQSAEQTPSNKGMDNSSIGATKVNSEKDAAQKILSSSTSTFDEKYDACQKYLDALAKPVGSLGALECWAARLCSLQGTMNPQATPVACIVFAGDHGVAASPEDGGEGCSLYPQAVTKAILKGLQNGVAGASVLANNVLLSVVDVGVVGQLFDGPVVRSSVKKLKDGTRNFCTDAAMTMEESMRCIQIGRDNVIEVMAKTGCKVIALGEVGIGNTTTASAVIAAMTGKPVDSLCGGGAYASHTADEAAIKKKIGIVSKALDKHKGLMNDPFMVLSKVGGAEVAALVGAILEASDQSLPVLVDGFIVTAAALLAASMKPSVCNVIFLSTKSAEKGHAAAVEQIQAIAKDNKLPQIPEPVLSMNLRMGEATGALLAVPILQSAASMISNMGTIQEILSS